MEPKILEKWKEIYYYAGLIVDLDPWSRFDEKDVFVLKPKAKDEEHFFSFLLESCGRCTIALYRSGRAYCLARERLHGKNTKNEPVLMLQDAVIFVMGDRENVSKKNYAIIKDIGMKCRGKGAWPFFEKCQVGYAPREIPEEDLDTLLDDLGNLWMMVRMIVDGRVTVDFAKHEAMMRRYNPEDDTFYSYASKLNRPIKAEYDVVTVNNQEWLTNLRQIPAKGSISLDWSYLPTIIKDEGAVIIPRLLLIVENRTGCILRATMLTPSNQPYEELIDELLQIIDN